MQYTNVIEFLSDFDLFLMIIMIVSLSIMHSEYVKWSEIPIERLLSNNVPVACSMGVPPVQTIDAKINAPPNSEKHHPVVKINRELSKL